MMDPIIGRLADFARDLAFTDLPPAVVHEAKRRIVDTAGCALGAFAAEPSRIARTIAARAAGSSGAPVLGTAVRTLPELAAFANGTMSRYLDANDCYPGGGGHPSDSILPLLGLADAAGTDGKAAITAIVLAYDIHHALFHGLRLIEKGLDHVFYVAVATAAGGAKLLRLDRAGIANAIAIAVGSFLPLEVVRHGELSMWKGASAGEAARAGLAAAALAQAGMTGPSAAFTGRHGLSDLIGTFELPPLAGGGRFRIVEADMKSLAAEYHAQGPILAALELRRDLDPASIEAVTVYTYAHAAKGIGSGAERWRPKTRETADHSLPYMVAAVLADGRFSDEIFAPHRLGDPKILAIADKVAVREDQALTARFPQGFPCRVEITVNGGTKRVAALDNPPGHHEQPLSDDAVVQKVRELAARHLASDRLGRGVDLIWALDRATSVDPVFTALRVEG
jgi:2-methylcitrate dehydratase